MRDRPAEAGGREWCGFPDGARRGWAGDVRREAFAGHDEAAPCPARGQGGCRQRSAAGPAAAAPGLSRASRRVPRRRRSPGSRRRRRYPWRAAQRPRRLPAQPATHGEELSVSAVSGMNVPVPDVKTVPGVKPAPAVRERDDVPRAADAATAAASVPGDQAFPWMTSSRQRRKPSFPLPMDRPKRPPSRRRTGRPAKGPRSVRAGRP